jgi:hypothetical protein
MSKLIAVGPDGTINIMSEPNPFYLFKKSSRPAAMGNVSYWPTTAIPTKNAALPCGVFHFCTSRKTASNSAHPPTAGRHAPP